MTGSYLLPGKSGSGILFKIPKEQEWLSKKIISKVKEKEVPKPDEEMYLCANCGYQISSKESLLKVCGSTTHNFINPSGIGFNILCFSSTLGLLNQGEFTYQFSWFPDYQWCYCHCINCFVHMGWFFKKPKDDFFGLIIDKLKQGF